MARPNYGPVRVAFVLLCLTLALTLVPLTAAPPPVAAAGSSDLVAYLDRTNQLWVSRQDGSAPRQLTPAGFSGAAWSPDGSRLAPVGPYNGGQGVYLTSPDGGFALQPLGAGDHPAWSPNSGDLAFVDNGTIDVFSRDGVFIRNAAVGADSILWSPNAFVVGYTRVVDDPYQTGCPVRTLGWFDASAGQTKEVARSIGAFAWAGDGRRLLYVSADDGAVHSYDIGSGANRTLSTRSANPCGGPFFTTTAGDRLLFLDYGAGGGTTLVSLNLDNGQERVYPNLPVGFPANTLPDAYVGADVGGSFVDLVQAYPTRITRLDLASGNLTTLLNGDLRGVLTFSPDHQQVVLVDNPYGKPTVASIRDLHSGAEVAFKNTGWLSFEPSPVTASAYLAWGRTWAREDRPVAAGAAQRSWLWGPSPFAVTQEAYADAPGGRRPVLYYDKSRMEINTPYADQSATWYVTNGLLVRELITGQMQVGDNAFVNRGPAQVNVAGDPNDPNGPTYASLSVLLSAPPAAPGTEIKASLSRDGTVAANGPGGVYARQLVPETNHIIADVFWDYLNSQGPIWDGTQFGNGALFNPTFFATGFPITEAYWTHVKVGGVERDVLLQCFERRCLTYTPSNPDGWKVEMGNVGQHYYTWRYGG